MKHLIKTLQIVTLLCFISSCTSVKVATDYDKNVSFDTYKTFAFFKTGIDKAEINDLDKRRILRAIESEMLAKGFTKSENPDLLVSLFTKSRKKVDVYNNAYGMWGWGWGWGWNPWMWGPPYGGNMVSTSTEGVLYVDLIDANKKELVWQGTGTGYLTQNMEKKEARIQEFVSTILEQYPPRSL